MKTWKALLGMVVLATVNCGNNVAAPTPDYIEGVFRNNCTDQADRYCLYCRVTLDGVDSGPETAYVSNISQLERRDPDGTCQAMSLVSESGEATVPYNLIIGDSTTKVQPDPKCPNASTWTLSQQITLPDGRVAKGSVVLVGVVPATHYQTSIDLR